MENTDERRKWFQSFMPLYEKAAPIIQRVTNPETLMAGELSVSPYSLLESNLTIQPIVEAVRKMPKPKEKQLASIQREFEIALSSCMKAAEAAVKYVALRERGRDKRAVLSTITNLTNLAHEHMESVSRRLTPYG